MWSVHIKNALQEPNLDDLRSDLLAAKEEMSAFQSAEKKLVKCALFFYTRKNEFNVRSEF